MSNILVSCDLLDEGYFVLRCYQQKSIKRVKENYRDESLCEVKKHAGTHTFTQTHNTT